MNPTLRDRFERLGLRLAELDATLSDPAVASDMKRWRSLSKEQAEVGGIVERYGRFQQRERDLAAAREMQASETDAEMAAMAQEEITAAGADVERMALELQTSLIPKDSDDERPVFLEIRAARPQKCAARILFFAGRLVFRWRRQDGAFRVNGLEVD